MSLCRPGHGSDVYVYESAETPGHWACCFCPLGRATTDTLTPWDMARHMRDHIAAGHHVPDHAIPTLIAEGIAPGPGH